MNDLQNARFPKNNFSRFILFFRGGGDKCPLSYAYAADVAKQNESKRTGKGVGLGSVDAPSKL